VDIYFKKRRWKQFILIAAIFIGIGSIFYTNSLVKKLSLEERNKAETLADAIRMLGKNTNELFCKYPLTEEENNYLTDIITFATNINMRNETIPILVVDKDDNIFDYRNLTKKQEKNIRKELAKLKAEAESEKKKIFYQEESVKGKTGAKADSIKSEIIKKNTKVMPIEISYIDNESLYLYYEESSLLVALRYFPIFQLLVIVIFIVIAYYAFNSSRKAEQNLVWVGMAKETAHQLGTPISSLIAWVQLLEDEDINPEIIKELSKDTDRLMKITDRFSKVGSAPELVPENIFGVLESSVEYLRKRISKKIELKTSFSATNELYIPISAPLFSWVIENLVRNSVDAIGENPGIISISVTTKDTEVEIDVTDNGKGISKSKFKTVFEPGYTTKKRGWGLGLSLSKRIISEYHKGKIYLKSSEPFKQTTFRMVLKREQKRIR
jgi:nitrogen-specific signal transduction histidine kinase